MKRAEPVLEVRGVGTVLRSPPGLRGGAPAPFALQGITFTVRRGETVALLGPNGAGKTSLIRLLAGVYRPRTGIVRVLGRRSPVIGFVPAFALELTVSEQLRAYAVALGIELDATAVLELAGLAAAAGRPVRWLSSGEQARLAIAPGLLAPVDLFLLDEALAVCDPEFRAAAVAVLERRVAEGAAVILAGQDLLSARLVCRRGLLLQNGRLVLDADLDTAVTTFTTQLRSDAVGAPVIERVEAPPASVEPGLVIPVRCRLRALSGPFQLLVAIKRGDGTVLYSSRAVFGAVPELDPSGAAAIELGIPASSLPPGTYRIAVAVCDAGGIPLTTREDAGLLRVAQPLGAQRDRPHEQTCGNESPQAQQPPSHVPEPGRAAL